jgi:4'-phosphopantetheinyl transferase
VTVPIDLPGGHQRVACPASAVCPDTILVWRVHLDVSDWDNATLPLSQDEQETTGRFAFHRDRRRFALARVALRLLLGSYVQAPAASVVLTFAPHGKPRPLRDAQGVKVFFNVAHSDELALIAVSHEREVGIDVERLRPLPGLDDIVAQHFAPKERRAFARAVPMDRLAAFYRFWTLKEAYLKADGIGLRLPLAEVDVSAVGEHPTALPPVSPSRKSTSWIAYVLNPGPEYAAALVVGGTARASVAMRDFVFPASLREPLTRTDRPHTVGTSVSSDG